MKNILFIIGLFIGALLFTSHEEVNSGINLIASTQEAIMKEKSSAGDVQHCIEALSNELKESTCLTPRRTVQTTGNTFNFRIQSNVEKLLQSLRLKNDGVFYKTSQNLSIYQSINISTLLCRMGQHVFSLRKLII